MVTSDHEKKYRAGELSDLLEISKKTLYSLEAQGLIPSVPRDWRGWRLYDESHFKAITEYQASKQKIR